MPIIQSLLDTDFYVHHGALGFQALLQRPGALRFQESHDTGAAGRYIDEAELRRELDHVRTLRVNPSELHYLRSSQ